jgi:enoyl-CoA hydratase/carnithine racemase
MRQQDDEVLISRDGSVQVITINRPHRRNAMTRAAGERIADGLDELDADPGLRVGVLTGAGGHFCSGMDLERFAAGESATIPDRGFAGFTQRQPAKPLVAAVEGFALAGGFEAVLACDLTVASRSALFGLPEVHRGLVARAGGLMRLPRRVPQAVAMEMILTGATIDAEQAHQWGLVNTVAEEGEALSEAVELAQRVALGAPLAVQVSKEVVIESADWFLADQFAHQSTLTDPVFASADAREGAQAFLEKRPAVWTGA